MTISSRFFSSLMPNFSGLSRMLCLMAAVYLAGVLATLLYNRIMAVIAQGTLKEIRDDMFAHMQTLPIKYFDTHTFGDVMSHYHQRYGYPAADDLPEHSPGVRLCDY